MLVCVTHTDGTFGQLGRVVRQGMGLQFVNHLQLMLDITQKHVGFLKKSTVIIREKVQGAEMVQAHDRVRFKTIADTRSRATIETSG